MLYRHSTDLVVFLFFEIGFLFVDRPGCPGISSVDHAGLKLGDLPASLGCWNQRYVSPHSAFMKVYGVEQIAQQLKMLVVLAKDLSSVSNTHAG